MIILILLFFCFYCIFLFDFNRVILVLFVVCMFFNIILFLGYCGRIVYILFFFFIKNNCFFVIGW